MADKPRAGGAQEAETLQNEWDEGGKSGKLLQRGHVWAVWESLRWLETGRWGEKERHKVSKHREGEERETSIKAWSSSRQIGLQILRHGPSLKGFEQELEAGQAGGRKECYNDLMTAMGYGLA